MSPQFLHWALQTEFSKVQNCKTITAPSSQQLCSDYQCNFFKSLNIHLRGFETSLVPKVRLPGRPNAKVARDDLAPLENSTETHEIYVR